MKAERVTTDANLLKRDVKKLISEIEAMNRQIGPSLLGMYQILDTCLTICRS